MQRTLREKSTNTNEIHTKHSTKCVANIPPGVGADSSCPYPNIIKYTYSHYQICAFTSLHTHFHIIKYVYSRHQLRVSVSPHTHIHIINYVFSHHRTRISATLFVGEYGYAGTINRIFVAANGWQHAASPLLYYNKLSP